MNPGVAFIGGDATVIDGVDGAGPAVAVCPKDKSPDIAVAECLWPIAAASAPRVNDAAGWPPCRRICGSAPQTEVLLQVGPRRRRIQIRVQIRLQIPQRVLRAKVVLQVRQRVLRALLQVRDTADGLVGAA